MAVPDLTLDEIGILANVATSVVSVVLTLFLVYLYHQQRLILNRQTELTESAQTALPRVRMYHLHSWSTLAQFGGEEGIEVQPPGYPERYAGFQAFVSNTGNGTARDIRAELVIQSPSARYSTLAPLAHKTNMDQIAFNDDGGVLSPEEGEVQMQSFFRFDEEDLVDEVEETEVSIEGTVTPSELLWILCDLEETPVEISIFIHYRDDTGVREPIQLLTSKSRLDSFGDLEEVYRNGTVVFDEVEPVAEYSPEK